MHFRRLIATLSLSSVACATPAGSQPGAPPPADLGAPDKPRLEVTMRIDPDEQGHAEHYADCVTLRLTAKGGPPREICTNAERGDLVPIFRPRQIAVPGAPSTVLLLGWTSQGAGNATVHAWIVRADGGKAPDVVDKLAWTAPRAEVGFVVDESIKLRIGVPWTFDDSATSHADTKFDFGSRERWLHLDDVKALSFDKITSNHPFYADMFGEQTRPAGTRVLWLDVTASGFAGEPVSRARPYSK